MFRCALSYTNSEESFLIKEASVVGLCRGSIQSGVILVQSVSNTRSGVLPTAAVVPEAASNVLVDVQHVGRPNSESSSNGTPASAPTTPRTAAAFPRTQRPPM